MQGKMLYLVRGLPGSGKSTFAQTLAEALGATHLEADQYFTNEEGEYFWNPALVSRAHGWCESYARAELRDGFTIVVSNTFTREKEMKPYLDMAEEYGYDVTTLIVENRHGNVSVHGVPKETMTKMRNRFSVKL